jgi:hypothetical protein
MDAFNAPLDCGSKLSVDGHVRHNSCFMLCFMRGISLSLGVEIPESLGLLMAETMAETSLHAFAVLIMVLHFDRA